MIARPSEPIAAAPSLTFQIPPAGDSPFKFRRAFLTAIRDAIAKAQIAGDIDAPLAVECFRALPMAEPRQ
jgi:hypothetical protein